MESLKKICGHLEDCVLAELTKDKSQIDAKELGEVVDAIKDIKMAIYYAQIVEAMEKPENVYGRDYDEYGKKYYTPRRRMRYYENAPQPYLETENRNGGTPLTPEQYRDMDYASHGRMYFTPMAEMDDMDGMNEKMGKSAMHRKKLLESMKSGDVTKQIEHLNHYADALSEDMDELTDMLNDNERNMLKSRIQVIMQKI